MAALAVVGVGERIGTATLLRGSVEKVRLSLGPLAVLWLAGSAVAIAAELAAQAAGITADSAVLTPPSLAYSVFLAVMSGVIGALGVRLCLERRWQVRDRGFLECAGLFTATALAFGLWMDVVSYVTLAAPVPFLGVNLALIVVGLVYLSLKLVLWAPGRLDPATNMTPTRSWRLMRRATRGYLLAHLVLAVPLMGLTMAAFSTYDTDTQELAPPGVILTELAYIAYAVASAAVTATLYELRVRTPRSVAEVFA